MNKIKIYFIYITWILASAFSVLGIGNIVLAQDPPEGGFFNQKTDVLPAVPKTPTEEYTDLSKDSDKGGVDTLLGTIRKAINRALGLLALIALIILIVTGFNMLINSKDDKKVEEGYKVVKNIAIALVFIGVSWLLVSFIFRAIGQFTGT